MGKIKGGGFQLKPLKNFLPIRIAGLGSWSLNGDGGKTTTSPHSLLEGHIWPGQIMIEGS